MIYIAYCLQYPQTLYIYFGVAVLVGILLGAILHTTFNFIIKTFGIDKASEERGRTLAAYRAEKAAKQARKARQTLPRVGVDLKPLRVDNALKDEYAEWLRREKSPVISPHLRSPGTRGLLSTTILEEDDSSEAGF